MELALQLFAEKIIREKISKLQNLIRIIYGTEDGYYIILKFKLTFDIN